MIARRQFITLLGGGVAAAWPIAARAQQQAMPLVGVISLLSPETMRRPIAAFRDGLKKLAITKARTYGRLPLCRGSIQQCPGIGVGPGSPSCGSARWGYSGGADRKTGDDDGSDCVQHRCDPVRLGLVASLNRPGGNLTGVVQFNQGLEAKRVGLLHEMVPRRRSYRSAPWIRDFVSAEARCAMSRGGSPLERAACHFACRYRKRNRRGVRDTRSTACWCAPGLRCAALLRQTSADCVAGRPPCDT